MLKQKDWTYDANGGKSIHEYPINKENYALMGLEFKLLDKAMINTNYQKVLIRHYMIGQCT